MGSAAGVPPARRTTRFRSATRSARCARGRRLVGSAMLHTFPPVASAGQRARRFMPGLAGDLAAVLETLEVFEKIDKHYKHTSRCSMGIGFRRHRGFSRFTCRSTFESTKFRKLYIFVLNLVYVLVLQTNTGGNSSPATLLPSKI